MSIVGGFFEVLKFTVTSGTSNLINALLTWVSQGLCKCSLICHAPADVGGPLAPSMKLLVLLIL
jgi:hypothetical protein